MSHLHCGHDTVWINKNRKNSTQFLVTAGKNGFHFWAGVLICRWVHKIAKIDYWLSVCRHGTTLLPLDWFSWNLIYGYFLKICWKSSGFIIIGQENLVPYKKTNIHFVVISRSHLPRMRNVSDESCRVNQNIFCSITYFRKSCLLWANVDKYFRAGQAAEDCMAHAHCMLDKKTTRAHTLSVCNTYLFSTAKVVARTRPIVTL